MNKTESVIAGERTQTTTLDEQTEGCKDWFSLHEMMRKDFERALKENEGLREAIRKHEQLEADRLYKYFESLKPLVKAIQEELTHHMEGTPRAVSLRNAIRMAKVYV
jgi:hypothetical protein